MGAIYKNGIKYSDNCSREGSLTLPSLETSIDENNNHNQIPSVKAVKDYVEQKMHSHPNSSVLNNLSISNNKLYYNGELLGVEGKSAYQVALENGFSGTELEWIDSLRGNDGNVSFDELSDEQKFQLKGEQGDKGEPFKFSDFTQEELDSLKGEKGDQGKGWSISWDYPSKEVMISDPNNVSIPDRSFVVCLDDGSIFMKKTGFIPAQEDILSFNNFKFIQTLNEAGVIKGDKGDKGDQGEKGLDGKSFEPENIFASVDEMNLALYSGSFMNNHNAICEGRLYKNVEGQLKDGGSVISPLQEVVLFEGSANRAGRYDYNIENISSKIKFGVISICVKVNAKGYTDIENIKTIPFLVSDVDEKRRADTMYYNGFSYGVVYQLCDDYFEIINAYSTNHVWLNPRIFKIVGFM